MRTRIKICGMTRLEDAEIAASCGADAIGMIFYPKSPRYVDLNQAKKIAQSIQPFVTTVAVVVDPDENFINEINNLGVIDRIQYHSDETPDFCEKSGVPYYKVLRVNSQTDIKSLANHYKSASAMMLDTYIKGKPGGTGQTFDWSVLQNINIEKPLILAGGLNPENIYQAVLTVKPYAIDLASGVEIKPGIKDAVKIKETIIAVREADQILNKAT